MKFSLRYGGAYLALGFLWLLHLLPLRVLRCLGWILGHLLFVLAWERRQVVFTNLRLCFPTLTSLARLNLARRHIVLFTQAFLDRVYLWWSSLERLNGMIQIEGLEHLKAGEGQPTILLALHFVGLDFGGAAAAMVSTKPLVNIYSNQKNPVFEAALFAGRTRFNAPILISRNEPIRKVIKAIREGHPLYYFPDQDYGPRDALFVPFFGVPAATITGLSRLAQLTGARIVPCLTEMTPQGYRVFFLPAWECFPSGNLAEDVARQNTFIEAQVEALRDQYFWLHKRFKTRPDGAPPVYTSR